MSKFITFLKTFREFPLKYIYVSLIVFTLDQFTKIAVRHFMAHQSISVIGDFFRLTHVENTAGAFGLGRGFSDPLNYILFRIAPIIVLIIVFYMLKSSKHKLEAFTFSLVIGGALGNITDRLIFGSVTDFFDFIWFPNMFGGRWPTFNIADSSIVLGVILLLIYTIFIEKRQTKEENE